MKDPKIAEFLVRQMFSAQVLVKQIQLNMRTEKDQHVSQPRWFKQSFTTWCLSALKNTRDTSRVTDH